MASVIAKNDKLGKLRATQALIRARKPASRAAVHTITPKAENTILSQTTEDITSESTKKAAITAKPTSVVKVPSKKEVVLPKEEAVLTKKKRVPPSIPTNISSEEELEKWCNIMAENGIEQHSDLWLAVKRFTIGGSSISILMGLNHFQTVRDLLASKLGLVPFLTDIKPQWGNMLEEVIKCEMEYIHSCKIYGEDLYLTGHIQGTSYSPDGLAMINDELVLMEFKCPYCRIPGRAPPKYYVPQVKMGLELINPRPHYGLYAEGVYRRCAWDELGPNGNFDMTLVDKPKKPVPPISYGFVGFYTTQELVEKTRKDITSGAFKYPSKEIIIEVHDDYDVVDNNDDDNNSVVDNDVPYSADGDSDSSSSAAGYTDPLWIPGFEDEYGEFDPQCYDLGSSTPMLMKCLMHALDSGRIKAYYSEIIRIKDEPLSQRKINAELRKYQKFINNGDYINYGVLPWKLLRIEQHRIEHEPDFLAPYVDQIASIIDFVKNTYDKGFSKQELWQKIDDFVADFHGGINDVDDC